MHFKCYCANVFIDQEIFRVATSLGFGQTSTSNPNSFKINEATLKSFGELGAKEGVQRIFDHINDAMRSLALLGGYDLNTRSGRIQFSNMIKNMSDEEKKERFGL